uniref:Uncharacterized protein n=1 Tax=Macaca fascicularis TaxID=9541 RepID=A0A7N9D0W4_MACFA
SQHFGRPRWVDHLRSGVRDQPDQHGETPSLLKIQKLAGRGGACLLRQENHLNLGGRGCSELRSRHCTPAWATEGDSVSKKKKNLAWIGPCSGSRLQFQHFGRPRWVDHLRSGV